MIKRPTTASTEMALLSKKGPRDSSWGKLWKPSRWRKPPWTWTWTDPEQWPPPTHCLETHPQPTPRTPHLGTFVLVNIYCHCAFSLIFLVKSACLNWLSFVAYFSQSQTQHNCTTLLVTYAPTLNDATPLVSVCYKTCPILEYVYLWCSWQRPTGPKHPANRAIHPTSTK